MPGDGQLPRETEASAHLHRTIQSRNTRRYRIVIFRFAVLLFALAIAAPAAAEVSFLRPIKSITNLFRRNSPKENEKTAGETIQRKRRAILSFEGDDIAPTSANTQSPLFKPETRQINAGQPEQTPQIPHYPTLLVSSSSVAVQWTNLAPSDLRDTHINVLQSSASALWISRKGGPIGVWTAQDDAFHTLRTTGFKDGLATLLLGDDQGCWLALGNGRLLHVAPLAETATLYTLPATMSTGPIDSATVFANRLWFKSGNKIGLFDPSTGAWMNGPAPQLSATMQRDGRLYCGNDGLLLVAPGEAVHLSPKGSVQPLATTDSSGRPATLTGGAGLHGQTILATRGSGMLVAEDGEALHFMRRLRRFQPVSLWESFNDGRGQRSQEDDLTAMAPGQDGLWLATAMGRILHYRPDTGARQVYARVYPPPAGRMTCIARQGSYVWLGSTAGLMRIPVDDVPQSDTHPLEKGHWIRYSPSDTLPALRDPQNLQLYAEMCRELGRPYVRGGEGATGFDCSGFAVGVLRRMGIELPHRSTLIHDKPIGTHNLRDLRFGDLVFFYQKGTSIFHTGIYLGEGRFVHSWSGANGVTVSSLADDYFPLTGVKRVALPGRNTEISSANDSREARVYLASAPLGNTPLFDKNDRPLSDPLLRARPESLRNKPLNAPFDLTVRKTSGDSNSFTLQLPPDSPWVFNRRIMVIAVSEQSDTKAINQKFRGSVLRRALFSNREDLAGVGIEGPDFMQAKSGAVFLVAASTDESAKPGGYRAEFRFGPLPGSVKLYAVALTGPQMGCLQALPF